MKNRAQRPSITKLRELVVYIAKRSEDDSCFGAVKLNKLLFYSDFLAFLHLGKSITGQRYVKLERGPSPERFDVVKKQMQHDGDIAVQVSNNVYGRELHRTFALRDPKPGMFTGEEVSLIEQVISNHA